MKFLCEKSELLSAVTAASRAVAVKSPIPDLEGIFIKADASLQVIGFNLETAIAVTPEADISEPGAVVLPARVLCDIIRKLPDGAVSVRSEASGLTFIESGNSKFRIMAVSDGLDYPELPDVSNDKGFKVPQDALRELISGTIFSVSEGQGRPVHRGCLTEFDGNSVTMVAIDGFRLARRTFHSEEPFSHNTKFVVPGTALREVEKLLSDDEEPAILLPDAKNIMFKIGNVTLVCRLLEGEFLDWRKVVPVNNPIVLVANVPDMLSSVERVSLITSDKIKTPVRCLFSENYALLKTKTASAEAKDTCSLAGDGKDTEIGFNGRYLMDALRAVPTDDVTLELSNPLSPIVLTPADDKHDFAYMVLPVRLKSED